MSLGSVRLVLGKRAHASGMVGSKLESISPYGPRADFRTTAYGNGAADECSIEHTRQKSLETMRDYVCRAHGDHDSPQAASGCRSFLPL